jgi:hypothetical protein
MKGNDRLLITEAIRQLLAGPLADAAAAHIAEPAVNRGEIPRGFHYHDA